MVKVSASCENAGGAIVVHSGGTYRHAEDNKRFMAVGVGWGYCFRWQDMGETHE